MKKLENNVAIVTGVSKGIGTSISKNFASEGAWRAHQDIGNPLLYFYLVC